MDAMPGAAAGAPKKANPWIKRGAITLAVVIAVALFVVGNGTGFDSRAAVTRAIEEAQPLMKRVEEFHRARKALPTAADASAWKVEAKRARRIEWDPGNREVVIAMEGERYPGLRFAYKANPGDNGIAWTCHAIDMPPKYLPAACRG